MYAGFDVVCGFIRRVGVGVGSGFEVLGGVRLFGFSRSLGDFVEGWGFRLRGRVGRCRSSFSSLNPKPLTRLKPKL